MAAEVLRDARVELGALVLGNTAREVTVEWENELLESTGFGDTARTYVRGFSIWRVTLAFYEDFTDNGLSEQLFTWATGTSAVAIKIRKSTAVIGPTNPEFQGNVLFTTVPLFTAQVGAIAGGSITLQGSGTLTRAVA